MNSIKLSTACAVASNISVAYDTHSNPNRKYVDIHTYNFGLLVFDTSIDAVWYDEKWMYDECWKNTFIVAASCCCCFPFVFRPVVVTWHKTNTTLSNDIEYRMVFVDDSVYYGIFLQSTRSSRWTWLDRRKRRKRWYRCTRYVIRIYRYWTIQLSFKWLRNWNIPS